MNRRAFVGCVRREVARGRRMLLWLLALPVAATVLAATLPIGVHFVPAVAAIILGAVALFGPSGDLAMDRRMGFLEFDRALPVSPELLAAGRMVGAAVRTSPFALCMVPILVAASRNGDLSFTHHWLVLLLVLAGVALLGWVVSWTFLALNARWAFRRIWWLGPTIGLAPSVLPELLPAAVKHALATGLAAMGEGFLAMVASPFGFGVVVLAAVALPLGIFLAAVRLYASGIRRFRFDPTDLQVGLGRLPRIELGSRGSGPALAVARLRLRIAAEQFRRELIMIAILLVVVLVGTTQLRLLARSYVRVLAGLLPGGVVLQLGAARAKGYLEALQQLPHAPRVIGLGHLLAVAALALPGAIVLILARLIDGGPLPSVGEGVSLWLWFVTLAWMATAAAVWIRTRYAVILGGVVTAAAGAWVAVAGRDAALGALRHAWRALAAVRATAPASFALGVFLLAFAIGLPLFAYGLAHYEYRPG